MVVREGGDPICFGVNPNASKRVSRRVKQPVVYILASKFTKQYGVHTLVHFEVHAGMYEAIQREKQPSC